MANAKAETTITDLTACRFPHKLTRFETFSSASGEDGTSDSSKARLVGAMARMVNGASMANGTAAAQYN